MEGDQPPKIQMGGFRLLLLCCEIAARVDTDPGISKHLDASWQPVESQGNF